MKIYSSLLIGLLVLSSCGEGIVTVDEANYEPKIVIEGYLYPNHPVKNILLTRNLPLNKSIDPSTIILADAEVRITDLGIMTTIYPLTFNPDSGYFEYTGSELQIQHGSSYRLNVTATIDGQELQAESTTKVPLPGFTIDDSASTPSIVFGKSNFLGFKKPHLYFSRSQQTDFYAFSIVAMDASVDNFIYDIHPWGGNIKEKDVIEFLDDFTYSHDTVFNTPLTADTQKWVVEWFHLWFYSRYRIIGYAGDENLKNYYLTHANVQEIDGNLHEPAFNIDGDGIGIFGSAIADTFFLEITSE
jgi:hypothetical protein